MLIKGGSEVGMKQKKRLVMYLFICMLSMSMTLGGIVSAKESTEVVPAWVSQEVQAWKALELLRGDSQGNLLLQNEISRVEFIAFINRIMNYQAESNKELNDVSDDAWFAADVKKAIAAQILQGDGKGNINPTQPITREEAAVIVTRVFQLISTANELQPFQDDANISAWAKEAVYTLKHAGFVIGNSLGQFEARKAITRAEAIKMINNVMGYLVADHKVHSDITSTNLVVNTSDNTLSNINLSGNLYITVGAAGGTIVLDNVNVTGTIYVNGNAKVVIRNSHAGQMIVSSDVEDAIMIELEGSTTVSSLTLHTATELAVGAQASIDTLTINAASIVTGTGAIETAVINAEGVSLSQHPNKLTLTADKVTIAGKVVTKDEPKQEPVDDDTSTGSGPSTPSSKATKLYSYEQMLSVTKPTASEALVQQYINFLQDPSYTPSIASSATTVPNLTNALTFVDASFDIKPSIFPSLRSINTSVLNEQRTILWIGTDEGVTKVKLSDNTMQSYTTDNKQLIDNRVLLIIADGSKGIFAITETGVSHIYQ